MGLREDTASGTDGGNKATEDLARQLEEANVAFLASRAGGDDATEVLRAHRLAVAIALNYAFFALLLGTAGVVFGDRALGIAAVATTGFGATAFIALALIRRGRVGTATLVAGYGVLLSVPVYSWLMPSAQVGVVLLPILAVGMMHPYLQGRRMAVTLAAAWMVALVGAVVGEFVPDRSETPEWFRASLHVVGVAAVSLLIMMQSTFFGRRLREQLERLAATNARLRTLTQSSVDLAVTNGRLFQAAQTELAERRRAEAALDTVQEQLRHAQKMEAVGRLAGGVAHDFNNMLSVILSYATLGQRRLPPGDRVREYLAEIQQAGGRAADLTRHLLAFSRQQPIRPVPVDINGVLGGLDGMLRTLIGEDVELGVALSSDLGIVVADPGQMEQIVINLAVNARDAMPRGGKLAVATANVDLDASYAREHLGVTAGPHVMLTVTDTGIGMDRATQGRIFEPFFTTKEQGKGTGLGLSIVFGIVQQSGGNIRVYSELGRGTTFKVYFPRVFDPPESASVRSAPPASPTRGTETVLLVEDEEQVRQLLCNILRADGYHVIAAASPLEALDLAKGHPGSLDLLLADVVMPQMNGRELADRLKPLRPEMRVLFISGYTGNVVVHNGVLDEGVAFLQKPIVPDALLRRLRDVLTAPTIPNTPPPSS
jgi:signal transduction histidine kinase/ActR/RegA family two-component response regulator